MILVDPPSGWKYGFPKQLDRAVYNHQQLANFLIENGYPQSMCDETNLKHTRLIEAGYGGPYF